MDLKFTSNVYQFQDHQVLNPPSFIKTQGFLFEDSSWMKESLEKAPQHIENFYKKFFPKKTPLSLPEKSQFFKYEILEDQSFQINFDHSMDETKCVHNFIYVKEGVFLYLFENESLPWCVNHIYLSPRSKVLRCQVTQRPHRSFVFSKLGDESCFFNFEVNVHSKESFVFMEGCGKNCVGISRSLNLLDEEQSVFEKTEHHQKAEGSYTRQFFRSVVGGKALSRVHSMALVDAQEVNSHQLLQSLLIGELAQSENKPDLKVFKDQVQATHGSTVGTVHPLEVFYLNSRGISKEQALKILIEAWVNQIFNVQDIKDEIREKIDCDKFICTIRGCLENLLKKKVQGLGKSLGK